MAMQGKALYAFGPFTLDPRERVLRRDGRIVPLTPKALDTLCVLVEAQGRVVDKAEMMDRVWSGAFVEEGNLTQSIFLVRKAVGDNFIETIPKRGYRFVGKLSPSPVKSRSGTLAIIGAVAAVLVIGAAVTYWVWFRPPSPGLTSIAVLPFANLSGDRNYDYFGDGLSEELTHALMSVEGLHVAARTSAFQFRGRNEDVRKIGRDLSVAAVLEGSARITADQVRVTAQLIDARSGYHVWSETYDGRLGDVLAIQQQIANAVAAKLDSRSRVSPPSPATTNRDAYNAYLQGRYFAMKGTEEDFRKARDYFEKAAAGDPSYARAYSGLADTFYRWAMWESLPPRQAFDQARQAAQKALALDDSLAEAHASLGNVKFQYDWDWEGAEREFRRSIALDPRRSDTWHWLSHVLTATGRFPEALEAAHKAIEIEPLDMSAQNHLGWYYYFAGDFDRAVDQHRKVLNMDPTQGQTRLLLGRSLLQQKNFVEAIEQLRKNLELSPHKPERIAALARAAAVSGDRQTAHQLLTRLLALARERYVSAYSIAIVYAGLGDRGQTLAYLTKACDGHAARVVEMKFEPAFRDLRRDRAFERLLTRMGL